MESPPPSTPPLPAVIPVFPLTGVILIPGNNLPLNIFEPRYLQMIRDAVTSNGLIGMIQPKVRESEDPEPELYNVGGVGKIDDLVETGKNQFAIRLRGIARFEVSSELSTTTPYRQAHVDWTRFGDVSPAPHKAIVDRRKLLATLSGYLEQKGLDADFDAIAEAPDDVLVNTLSMIIPMGAPEKQALLEADTVTDRGNMLETLLKMALIEDGAKQPSNLH